MKSEKSLEKFLNSKGYELYFGDYGYWHGVPIAKDGNLEIVLAFLTTNEKYNWNNILTCLESNLTKTRLEFIIEKCEEIYKRNPSENYFNLGDITYKRNGRVKINYDYEYYEGV